MVLSAVGFAKAADDTPGSVSATAWARMQELAAQAYRGQLVSSGFGVTANAAARTVNVGIGEALLPGLLVTSTAVEQVTFPAATGTRRDYVALQADWAANAQKGALSLVRTAALVQNAGGIWQMPLAVVTVRSTSGAIPGSDIAVAAPTPRVSRQLTGDVGSGLTVSPSSNGVTLAEVQLNDPGWPYHVQVTGTVRYNGDSGYLTGSVQLPDQGGSTLGQGTGTPVLTVAGTAVVVANAQTLTPLTGPQRVRLVGSPLNVSAGNPISILGGGTSKLHVRQIPA